MKEEKKNGEIVAVLKDYSINGTFVNNKIYKNSRVNLKNGDVISLIDKFSDIEISFIFI